MEATNIAGCTVTDDVHLSESSESESDGESESDSESSLSEHFVENEDGDEGLVLFTKDKVNYSLC